MAAMEKMNKLLLIMLLPALLCAGLKGKVDDGNGRYYRNDYEGAISKYQDAEIDEP